MSIDATVSMVGHADSGYGSEPPLLALGNEDRLTMTSHGRLYNALLVQTTLRFTPRPCRLLKCHFKIAGCVSVFFIHSPSGPVPSAVH